MSRVQVGQFAHRVRMQSVTETSDGAGGFTETWNDIADTWVSIQPLRGRELFEAQQVNSDITHKVVGHYDSRFTTANRFIHHDGRKGVDRTFDVEGVITPQEAGETFEMRCKEVT